jgi:ligand-binding sensor domain-containing protein
MVNVKLVFILFLAIVCSRQDIFGQLRANDFIIKHFTTDDGLPSNSIYTCTPDQYGYIWFATENGIARFDGKHFRNFDASHGLLDNMVLGTERIENFIIGYGFKGMTFIQLVSSNNFKFKRRLNINAHGGRMSSFISYLYNHSNDTLNLINIKNNTEEKISINDSGRMQEIFKNYTKVFYDFYPSLIYKKDGYLQYH